MEVSTNQGKTWQGTQRQTYNFFEISGGVGASSAWIRVTRWVYHSCKTLFELILMGHSMSGSTVVIQNVPMTGNAVKQAPKNYS